MPRVRLDVWQAPPLEGHALLDSGGGEKLERFGELVLRRPDPQALWAPRLEREVWEAADLSFERESDRGGRWRAKGSARGRLNDGWSVDVAGLRASI